MTIGSTYNYSAIKSSQMKKDGKLKRANEWAGRFPSPPDLSFNYKKLMLLEDGIGNASDQNHRICIIGAGITGLTIYRELMKCGFKNIHLYEARNMVGGRHDTITVNADGKNREYAPFEMGAMRMPFFNTSDETPLEGESLLAHYCSIFGLYTEEFPNPGTKWIPSTGIYLEEGTIGDSDTPEMLIWENTNGITPPPTQYLQDVYDKWKRFEKLMVDVVSEKYGTDEWESMWAAIVKRYEHTPFRQFVLQETLDEWDESDPGNFGGLGLNEDESNIFYSIGFGDGSWGAFYDVCTIYPLRTAIFGFGSNLQLIPGRYDIDGGYNPGPYYENSNVLDSNNVAFEGPKYQGIRALDECMFFIPLEKDALSPFEKAIDQKDPENSSFKFYSSTRVTNVKKNADSFSITSKNAETESITSQDYDSVIITVPSWIMEVEMPLEGFTREQLPMDIIRAYKTAHWETSQKVYCSIDKSFFTDTNNKIPHILVTDSFIHDVYIYEYGVDNLTPCILISYTWEDDATKLASFSEEEVIQMCIDELDRILMRSENIGQKISPYIVRDNNNVRRWITEPHSLGCAKLYRAGTYSSAMKLLEYNRKLSPLSQLYLAGESFSVDAGWTEPCLRGAIDTVINICNNTDAIFNKNFSMDNYPHYQT